MAQTHRQTAMTQDNVISEFGIYDAGWTATCQCGTDFSPRRGRASKAQTQRAIDAHLTRHGALPTAESGAEVRVRHFHGTAADLPIGGTIEPGHVQRWDYAENLGWVYLTTDQDSARGWAFRGLLDDDERSRLPWIYEVQPTGPVEPDPLEQIGASGQPTDFRSHHPLKIIAKVPAGGTIA